MTWQTDDGEHEGAALGLFADGALAGTYHAGGVVVSEYADGTRAEPMADLRTNAEVIGWRAWCSCGWRGSTYTRAASSELEDRARRLAYVLTLDPYAPSWVEDAVHDEWLTHVAPAAAMADLAAAARDVAAAAERLDEAALNARRLGAAWGAIGSATAMTRQAAHLRWAKRANLDQQQAV